jgi:D-lactate dehydrogenase (cytochrome)
MKEVSKSLKEITKKHGGQNFEFAKTDAEADKLWEGRKTALWSVLALEDGARVWTTDVWLVAFLGRI